jgi:hypothetical protein
MSTGFVHKLFYRLFIVFWELMNTLNGPIKKLMCVEGVLTSLPEQLLGGQLDSTNLIDIELALRDPLWQCIPDEDGMEEDDTTGREQLNYMVASVGKLISSASKLQCLSLSLLGDEGVGNHDDTWCWDTQAAYLPEPARRDQEQWVYLWTKKSRMSELLEHRYRDVYCSQNNNENTVRAAYSTIFLHVWRDLRYLHLRQVPISDEDLVSFIRRHRNSLCAIVLENYSIPFRIIDAMRDMTELQLDKIEISQDAECTGLFVTPRLLRNYINNVIALPDKVEKGEHIVTHTMVWPCQEDFKTGLDLDLARIWDEKGIRYLYDRENDTADAESVGKKNDENDPDTYDSWSIAEVHTHSSESWLDRQRNPWWKMARLSLEPDALVFYWKVPPGETGGRPTAVWHFKHRSGGVALGTEPFTFFGDWDETAWDRALPTPHSDAFDSFVDHEARCTLCGCDRATCARAQLSCIWELWLEKAVLPKCAREWCPTPGKPSQYSCIFAYL